MIPARFLRLAWMLYLGNRQWIQADPVSGRVPTVAAPSENTWFEGPMSIVRWRLLQP